jgi:hypothetical protein
VPVLFTPDWCGEMDMNVRTNHQTLPIKPAPQPEMDRFVTVTRYKTPSLADVETIVLVGMITILSLCIVGSFVYLIRSMVPPV